MRNFKRARALRRGLAPLEMMIALPTMTALMVLLFYVGKASVQQMELAKTLHFKTWSARYDESPSVEVKPLVCDDATQGKIDKTDEDVVKTGLIYDKFSHQKKSESAVFVNTWSSNSDDATVSGAKAQGGNQLIYYYQTTGKTYMHNTPEIGYYWGAKATPIRNTDYVDNCGGGN